VAASIRSRPRIRRRKGPASLISKSILLEADDTDTKKEGAGDEIVFHLLRDARVDENASEEREENFKASSFTFEGKILLRLVPQVHGADAEREHRREDVARNDETKGTGDDRASGREKSAPIRLATESKSRHFAIKRYSIPPRVQGKNF